MIELLFVLFLIPASIFLVINEKEQLKKETNFIFIIITGFYCILTLSLSKNALIEMEVVLSFVFLFFIVFVFVSFALKKKKLAIYLMIFCISNLAILFIKLSNLPYECGMAKGSCVKGNMHTFQTMLETYSVDWHSYPSNVEVLQIEAEAKNYWKEFRNPFNGKIGLNISFADMVKNKVKVQDKAEIEGCIYYEPIRNKDKTVTKYFIYGTGKNGYFLDDRKGELLTFTNN